MIHPNDGERRGWHIGREIPLALLLMIVVQTASFVWWLAGLSERVSAQGLSVSALSAKVDAIASNSTGMVTAARVSIVEAELKEARSQIDALRSEVFRRGR